MFKTKAFAHGFKTRTDCLTGFRVVTVIKPQCRKREDSSAYSSTACLGGQGLQTIGAKGWIERVYCHVLHALDKCIQAGQKCLGNVSFRLVCLTNFFFFSVFAHRTVTSVALWILCASNPIQRQNFWPAISPITPPPSISISLPPSLLLSLSVTVSALCTVSTH